MWISKKGIEMTSICLYFKVHQPWRIRNHWNLDSSHLSPEELEECYFEKNDRDKEIFEKVAKKCYYPANDVLLEAINEFEDGDREFRFCMSLTGMFIEQCREFDPEVLESFRKLVDTGKVEILAETYHHSLTSLFESMDEFEAQVEVHRKLIKDEFGVEPKVFSNTEALYNNRIAEAVEGMGFEGIITEGADRILGWRSPNYLYRPPEDVASIPIITKNYRLSDDVAFRFSARWWDEWPLTADKYASWLDSNEGDVINLSMDYETFGEHQWADTGIFSFLRSFPHEALGRKGLEFEKPSEVIEKYEHQGEFDVFEYNSISWADMERDESAWLGNWMQKYLFNELKLLGPLVKKTDNKHYLEVWRKLLASDHLYYLSTKGFGDGDVHSYFSSFDDHVDAFRSFLEVVRDFKMKILGELDGPVSLP